MNPAEPNTNPTTGTGPDPATSPATSGIPASDPLAPATNTPDGQAMMDQALGTTNAYGADPLATIHAAADPAIPTPGPETGTMVDPLASVSSSTPATDPLVAAPPTDPFASAAATPAATVPEVPATPASPVSAEPAPATPVAAPVAETPVMETPAMDTTAAPIADPDPLAGAVESLSSAPLDVNSSAEPVSDYAQPAAPNFANDPTVAAAPEKNNEDQSPIQPAAPAPGSIGSSTSYTDYQAAATQAAAAPAKKKSKTTLILLIVVLAILLIGGGIFAFVMLSGNKSSNSNTGNNNSSTPAPSVPVEMTLVCATTRSPEDLVSAGGATVWDEEMTIKYEDDDITKITDVSTVEYPDSATAKAGIENFKNYYASLLSSAGLTSDPFDSRYARVDGTLTITYTGLGERLNAQNAVIFNLPVEDDELKSDPESVKAYFTEKNYTCQEKDD